MLHNTQVCKIIMHMSFFRNYQCLLDTASLNQYIFLFSSFRDDVQKVFDKYCVNFVRRLNKDKALEMFAQEFQLDADRAELMFDTFDKDRNSVLSAWEFYLFFVSFGYE